MGIGSIDVSTKSSKQFQTTVQMQDAPRWLRESLKHAYGASEDLRPVRTATPTPQPSPATLADRRGDDRAKTSIYRVALLRWDGVESLCLIRNISPGGLMCEVPIELTPATRVTVVMRSGQSLASRVVWARDQRIGVEFDARVDVPSVLSSLQRDKAGWKSRMPRVAAQCQATLTLDEIEMVVDLLDVSQGGAKIAGEHGPVGDAVTVSIDGIGPRRAIVRWVRDGQTGVQFLTAIPFDTLARWTLAHRPIVQAPPPA